MDSQKKFSIDVYSHYFVVKPILPNAGRNEKAIIKEFIDKNSTFSYNKVWFNTGYGKRYKFVKEISNQFCTFTKNNMEIRFHISQYNSFMTHLANNWIKNENLIITKHDVNKIDWPIIDLKMKKKIKLKTVQQEALDFCLKYTDDHRTKLISLQTGVGKSITSMAIACAMKSRFILVVNPRFMAKWKKDVLGAMDVNKNEIILVNGGDSLRHLLTEAQENKRSFKKIKSIIISNRTLQNFIGQYEKCNGKKCDDYNYPCNPDQMFELLGAKVTFLDEGHLDFHMNFVIMLYLNTELLVTTSATMNPDNPSVKKMTYKVYPACDRFDPDGTVDPYIRVVGFHYNFQYPKLIRYKRQKGYNHLLFEASMMDNDKKRHTQVTQHYFEMLAYIIKKEYVSYYTPGFKTLVFCATVDMATALTDYFKKVFSEYDCRRYVEKDPYENILEGEILVSSIGKAGAAVDIPGLYLTIMTNAISSTQANKQAIGREREIKDGNPITGKRETPVFYYLCCDDIKSHVDYALDKRKIYSNIGKSFSNEWYNIRL